MITKTRKNVSLTPSCIEYIKEEAKKNNIKFSAMVESMILEYKNQIHETDKEYKEAIIKMVNEFKNK